MNILKVGGLRVEEKNDGFSCLNKSQTIVKIIKNNVSKAFE